MFELLPLLLAPLQSALRFRLQAHYGAYALVCGVRHTWQEFPSAVIAYCTALLSLYNHHDNEITTQKRGVI